MNSPVADCSDMISKTCCFLRLARIFCNYKKWECCYFEICLLGFNFFDCLLTTGDETPTWHSDIGNFKVIIQNTRVFSVADPGFPRGGANTRRNAPTYYLAIYSENCKKMKEFGLGERGARPTVTFFWILYEELSLMTGSYIVL